jgi:leucyl/phenylalanyl-tRNA---protein transferase
MPLFALDRELIFPPVDLAEPDGLLAMGGDLSPQRLLLAYQKGIFPWYKGEPILWWCPDPRFVLFPSSLKISKSKKTVLKNNEFEFRTDTAFHQVIAACKTTYRPGQDGTWITEEVEKAYIKMYELGYAHSAEAWKDGELAGGLYGILIGKVFFGESMFSKKSNASKFAFISYTQELMKEGIQLIDCQIYSEHLESLGANMIPRKEFTLLLKKLIP